MTSQDPSTGETIWSGSAAGEKEVDAAVSAARRAFAPWANTPALVREENLRVFQNEIALHHEELSYAIALEVGKPLWESRSEVDSILAKVDFTIEAHRERASERSFEKDGVTHVVRYRPHGVIAILGPFNFPAHLPAGHFLPALLAGNAVIFKPSEHAPRVGALLAQCVETAFPKEVFQLIQGGAATGSALTSHPEVDGIFFTGSRAVGIGLHKAYGRNPGKVLALEMGGNNPLVVWSAKDLDAAAEMVIRSSFLSAGQRCSCARRLIVEDDAIIKKVAHLADKIRIGRFDDTPEPYMGPVISKQARDELLAVQIHLISLGGKVVRKMERRGERGWFLTPGILDVTDCSDRPDEEYFGPFLQVIRVRDFEGALREAASTRYGLCAGIITDDESLYHRFRNEIRAGVINWNRPLTGASGALPFGGVGESGNHRPGGFHAIDHCVYPVASLESRN